MCTCVHTKSSGLLKTSVSLIRMCGRNLRTLSSAPFLDGIQKEVNLADLLRRLACICASFCHVT